MGNYFRHLGIGLWYGYETDQGVAKESDMFISKDGCVINSNPVDGFMGMFCHRPRNRNIEQHTQVWRLRDNYFRQADTGL